MRAAADTNVILYAEGLGDIQRSQRAGEVLYRMTEVGADISVQVCGEAIYAMTRKFRLTRAEALRRMDAWIELLSVRGLSAGGFLSALTLTRDHSFQIFDAMILATAAEGQCQLLVSEDMQDGFVWRGVTVVNPFAPKMHNLLKSYLDMKT